MYWLQIQNDYNIERHMYENEDDTVIEPDDEQDNNVASKSQQAPGVARPLIVK